MNSTVAAQRPVYNFCSGPAMLPSAVLERAKSELLDYQGSGVSVMEMSHRSDVIVSMFDQAEQTLRALLAIPDDYAVLFLQGGASLQFSAVPMNLMSGSGKADYLLTGVWSQKAAKEASLFGQVSIVASDEARSFTSVPAWETWTLDPKADYLHVTPNETIHGVEFTHLPDTAGVPVVADMSSTLLSRPLDVSRYGLIYAGAQKNIGPAGLTLVIVRRDLLKAPERSMPQLMRYDLQAQAQSMINTPPTFAVYLAGLVFDWLVDRGGLAAMAELNQRKAQKLYHFLDSSDYYANPVRPDARSWMNIPFVLSNAEREKAFVDAAQAQGLVNLQGHRSVGGMRASLYNAMPEAGVDALIDFLKDFEKKNG